MSAATIALFLFAIIALGFGAWLLLCAIVLIAVPGIARWSGDALPPVILPPLLIACVGIAGALLFISGAAGFASIAVSA